MHFSSLIAPVFALLGAVSGNSLAGRAAQLTKVNNFGDNPSGTGMYIYVPTKLAAKPPIIVAIHYCQGIAQAYYQGSPYAKLADEKGFIVSTDGTWVVHVDTDGTDENENGPRLRVYVNDGDAIYANPPLVGPTVA